MRNNLSSARLDNVKTVGMQLKGITTLPLGSGATGAVVAGMDEYIRITGTHAGPAVALPYNAISYTQSTTAVAPAGAQNENLVQRGSTFMIRNSGTNTVTIQQPDASTSVTTIAAGAAKRFVCLDPTSTTAGWEAW